MAMAMAAPNLSQTTSSATQSDFQTSSSSTANASGMVVKAEVGCMTMSMPNGTPMINCISQDGGSNTCNNFNASTTNCVGSVPGGGGGEDKEAINGTGIGISTMSAGVNTSPPVVMPSNSISTGTSTIGLEFSRKPILMNGTAATPLTGGGLIVGNTNFSCSAAGVSTCQQTTQVGNPTLISNSTIPVKFYFCQFLLIVSSI